MDGMYLPLLSLTPPPPCRRRVSAIFDIPPLSMTRLPVNDKGGGEEVYFPPMEQKEKKSFKSIKEG